LSDVKHADGIASDSALAGDVRKDAAKVLARMGRSGTSLTGLEDPRVQGDIGTKERIAPMNWGYVTSRGIHSGAVSAPFTHLA
jgi:hypothetical protein